MDIEAYILIGGRSSRLGRDKAFVTVDGKTLAERALETIRNAGIASKTTFVAGNSTQFAIEAITLDAPFIFDLIEDRGPLGGLHAALSYAKTDWIFVLACDYPFVSSELIRLFAKVISSDFGAVVPQQQDGKLQPLCAFYKVEKAGKIVEEIIQAGRVPPSMREIVKQLNPCIVTAREYSHLPIATDFFLNINTLDDFETMREIERKLLPEK